MLQLLGNPKLFSFILGEDKGEIILKARTEMLTLDSAVAWGGAGGPGPPQKLVNTKLKYSIQKKHSNNFRMLLDSVSVIISPVDLILFS